MASQTRNNRLNDLDPKDWLKFQKSWFIHNPPPRRKELMRHPAKFPETLAQQFIEFFTKREQVVFDPMAGTGSTLVAALRAGRHSYGIELNPAYVELARQTIAREVKAQTEPPTDGRNPASGGQSPATEGRRLAAEIFPGDAGQAADIIRQNHLPPFDYVLTSPPYWDMLHARGFETQAARRNSPDLDTCYSSHPDDLGNVHDYEEFLQRLVDIYRRLQPFLKPGAYLTIIVKNVKKGGKLYPLAWDLATRLAQIYALKDEKIWCQDNQRLAPYGMGSAWVSNTFHHYCLQFRNE